jgi:cyclic-di-GMP-binding protein
MPTVLQTAPFGRSGNLPRRERITDMASDSSFDIVSKVDHQEVDNALNQAAKEVATRFDFKNTSTGISWRGEDGIEITSSTEERCKAALDVLKDKLVRRQVSLKALDAGEPRQSGKETKIQCSLKAGISKEQASKLNKMIRDSGPKGVKSQVMGDEVRVSSKSATTCRRRSPYSRAKSLTSPYSSSTTAREGRGQAAHRARPGRRPVRRGLRRRHAADW